MTCPECGSIVAMKRNRCEKCGEDLTTYKKMFMLSNRYYNEGLEKAKVRDLSGAIIVLKNCLEINKRNTHARNLLGLVYYEMGETVSALSEWVISKHFQAEDNDADEYMNALQSNPTRLDSLNQTIKKYNSALQSAKQGNEDLAIIQLKKVVNLNPHFVKALQLLALLYIKTGEEEKAIRCLVKASKIDVSNTTTLRYLKELGQSSTASHEDGKGNKENNKNSVEPTVFPRSPYREERPNIWAWVNLFIGVIIGIAALYFLIVPTVKSNYINKQKLKEIELNDEINKQTQKISTLEKENKSLQSSVDKLQKQVDDYKTEVGDGSAYDQLLKAAEMYLTELEKNNPNEFDYAGVASELAKVNKDSLEGDALQLYTKLTNATYVKAAENLYEEGHNLYSAANYEDALKTLLEAYEYDPANLNAIYFIGRAYQQMGDNENAIKYYKILTENYADSGRASEARGRLSQLE